MLDPRQFFRFAAESYDLLRDLYYRTEGVSDGRLRELVAARRREGDSSVDTQVANLQRLRMIEASPGTEAHWELTHQVRSLMRFLLREHRLTSVRVIQGYLDSLEDARTGLADAVSDGDGDGAVRAVSEVTETVERLRQDSSANREAIFLEVMKIRSNRERLPGQAAADAPGGGLGLPRVAAGGGAALREPSGREPAGAGGVGGAEAGRPQGYGLPRPRGNAAAAGVAHRGAAGRRADCSPDYL